MKPTLVADEMFPEGAGPYVELEEVIQIYMYTTHTRTTPHIHTHFFVTRLEVADY
ncbi:uncharacterized protein LOC105832911 isoform X3 [Monomorium pharaonis]|uniref:uncharacterized protein LOC105832911 isoform X3 n=1 Tax=Monomorium pharaonis TaxID=307658 RepID=UPI001747D3EB|nr:uncharacterized protein LOC105832911 isoform X3 [Monomorium pharaonis]